MKAGMQETGTEHGTEIMYRNCVGSTDVGLIDTLENVQLSAVGPAI